MDGKRYHVAIKPLYSTKEVSEPMTLAEAKSRFERLTIGWTAQARSAYLRHLDNMDNVWIERVEDAASTEPQPVGVFERD